jgi:hypothetical protein
MEYGGKLVSSDEEKYPDYPRVNGERLTTKPGLNINLGGLTDTREPSAN